MSKYALWLQSSGKTAYRLQEKIKKLSAKYEMPVFAPHITLLGGLSATKTELVSLVETLAATLHPFELTLTTVDHRSQFYQCLFVHVEQSKQLMELRKMAVSFFNVSQEEEYMPHLSLLYGNFSPKEKGLMMNDIGQEFFISFPVSSLVLMQTKGTPNQWNKIYTSVFKRTL